MALGGTDMLGKGQICAGIVLGKGLSDKRRLARISSECLLIWGDKCIVLSISRRIIEYDTQKQ